jgi:hypothetical protein
MPHPADHPAAALAITRGLPGQLQKAKANGDLATAAAIEHALARARRIVRTGARRHSMIGRDRRLPLRLRRIRAGPKLSWIAGRAAGGDPGNCPAFLPV